MASDIGTTKKIIRPTAFVEKNRTVIGLVCGLFLGACSTAFTLGMDRQDFMNKMNNAEKEIGILKEAQKKHEEATNQELGRFSDIISSQVVSVQESLLDINDTMGELKTEVSVVKAILERVEDETVRQKNK